MTTKPFREGQQACRGVADVWGAEAARPGPGLKLAPGGVRGEFAAGYRYEWSEYIEPFLPENLAQDRQGRLDVATLILVGVTLLSWLIIGIGVVRAAKQGDQIQARAVAEALTRKGTEITHSGGRKPPHIPLGLDLHRRGPLM